MKAPCSVVIKVHPLVDAVSFQHHAMLAWYDCIPIENGSVERRSTQKHFITTESHPWAWWPPALQRVNTNKKYLWCVLTLICSWIKRKWHFLVCSLGISRFITSTYFAKVKGITNDIWNKLRVEHGCICLYMHTYTRTHKHTGTHESMSTYTHTHTHTRTNTGTHIMLYL